MTKIQKQSVQQLQGLYHHVLWTITPRPVWIIGTSNKDGTANFSTITCVSNTPGPPENIIISTTAAQTISNIQRTGEFSANLCKTDMAPLADYLGSVSGTNGPKNAMPYTYTWGEKTRTPILDASRVVLECKLSHTHVVGIFTTFFGEVQDAHFDIALAPPTTSQEAAMKWFMDLDIPATEPLVYHSLKKYYRVGSKV